MKCIILAGVPRSGKSSLANKLCLNSSFSRFPTDPVISMFEKFLPDYGIAHQEDYGKTCAIFRPIFFELIDQFEYEFMDVVVDGGYILPKWFLKKSRYKVVFLGYPIIDCKVKFEEIRRFENDFSWTKDISDIQLMDLIKIFIAQSKEQKLECKKFGIKFVDTSVDFELTLDKILEELHDKKEFMKKIT